MAKSNDDLANALAALAAGEVKDDHDAHGGSGTQHASEQTAPPPAKAPARPAPAPAAARTAAPAAPIATPAVPKAAVPTPPAARPVAPARPSAPTPVAPARPTAPVAARPTAAEVPETPVAPAAPPARVRPAAPTRPMAPVAAPLPVAEPVAEEESHAEAAVDETPADPDAIYDDGDAVIVPAPSVDVFKSKPKPTPKPKAAYGQSMDFKQTLIPIMLTLGVIGLLSAAFPFVAPASSGLSQLKDQPMFLSLVGGVGAVFLLFAGLNMMQVKSALDASKRGK